MSEELGDLQLIEPIRKTTLGYMWRANLRSTRRGAVAATVIGGAPEHVARVGDDLRARVEAGQDFRHPFVVRATDVVADGGRLALVADYVEGCTLGELVASRPLSGAAAIEVVRKAARALHAAYDRSPKGRGPYGLVHGGLDADALLISADGGVRLLGPFAPLGHRLASGDQPIATMAPEAMDGAISHRADVYALGALLFQALSGGPPPFASTQSEWHAAVVAAAGQRVADGLGSDALTRLLTAMLSFDPADRPDASDVEARAEKLKGELSGESLEEVAAARVADVVRLGHVAVLRQMADERDAPPPSVPPQPSSGPDAADDEDAATLRLDPAAVAALMARSEAEAAAAPAQPPPAADAAPPAPVDIAPPLEVGTPPKGARRKKASRGGKGAAAQTLAETAATMPGIPSPAPAAVAPDAAPPAPPTAADPAAAPTVDAPSIPPVQPRTRTAERDELSPRALRTSEVTVFPAAAMDLAEANAAPARLAELSGSGDVPPARPRPASPAPAAPAGAEDPTTDPSFDTRAPLASGRTQHTSQAAARPVAPPEPVDDDEVRQSSGGVTALLIVGVLLIVMAWVLWPAADTPAEAPAEAPAAAVEAVVAPEAVAPVAVPVVAPEPDGAEPFTVEGDPVPTPEVQVLVPVAPGVRATSSAAPAAAAKAAPAAASSVARPAAAPTAKASAPAASKPSATTPAVAPAAAATKAAAAPTAATPTAAAATTPTAAAATPAPAAAGSLTVAGDAHSVVLVAGGQRYGQGALPAGSYSVMVVYTPNGAEVDGGTARVPAGGAVTVTCKAAFLRCSSR